MVNDIKIDKSTKIGAVTFLSNPKIFKTLAIPIEKICYYELPFHLKTLSHSKEKKYYPDVFLDGFQTFD